MNTFIDMRPVITALYRALDNRRPDGPEPTIFGRVHANVIKTTTLRNVYINLIFGYNNEWMTTYFVQVPSDTYAWMNLPPSCMTSIMGLVITPHDKEYYVKMFIDDIREQMRIHSLNATF